jgi:hypothetical protein
MKKKKKQKQDEHQVELVSHQTKKLYDFVKPDHKLKLTFLNRSLAF